MRVGWYVVLTVVLLSLSLPIAVTAASPAVSENVQLCLGCHGNKDFSLDLPNKEKLSLFIDLNTFTGSVHGTFDCSLCHAGFSAEKHPGRVLKNRKGIRGHGFVPSARPATRNSSPPCMAR